MGKGDYKRPCDKKKFDEGFEAAFGKKELKLWNPDEDFTKDCDSPDRQPGTEAVDVPQDSNLASG